MKEEVEGYARSPYVGKLTVKRSWHAALRRHKRCRARTLGDQVVV